MVNCEGILFFQIPTIARRLGIVVGMLSSLAVIYNKNIMQSRLFNQPVLGETVFRRSTTEASVSDLLDETQNFSFTGRLHEETGFENNGASSTSPSNSPADNSTSTQYTVIIRIGGEMGNHLSRIAYGYSMSWMLKEDYGISSNIILEHENNHKWANAETSMKNCFLNFRETDFAAANTNEFRERENQQEQWLGHERHTLLYSPYDCQDEACIRMRLETMVQIISNTTNPAPDLPDNSKIALPYLLTCTFGSLGYINDRFHERLKNLFLFNESSNLCCSERSPGNETVLHARGFLTELVRRGRQFGYEELSPNKTVHEIIRNHGPGRRVSVLGRYQTHAQPYLDRMREAGLEARFVETENGEQSFCYLMSAKEDIMGIAMSTFAVWASYWGNASSAQLYSVRSPARMERFGDQYFFHFNFTNPTLKKKISFRLYNSEA